MSLYIFVTGSPGELGGRTAVTVSLTRAIQDSVFGGDGVGYCAVPNRSHQTQLVSASYETTSKYILVLPLSGPREACFKFHFISLA